MFTLSGVQAMYKNHENLEYIFFAGHQKTPNGTITKTCLSQWYASPFEMNNVRYKCAEQYMMCEKARLFKDEEAVDEILKAYHPNQMRLIGKRVKNFDDKVWNDKKIQIVKIANLAKFSQNTKLKRYLINTKNKVLVKNVLHDKIWGIGLAKNSELRENPLNWNGDNLLGFILMDIREILS
ncbi:MAG: NADAR family protein [Clostridium sp.]|nr:NADAR family protein [Clostridium sp.]